jgi:phosphoribosylformimino-5-aminoimidazole carboxamide ribotide isomerase
MIAIPAVDLRDGACVQLVGGSFADERVRIEDPVAVAARWASLGFSRLHVVDLDAAVGSASNAETINEILTTATARTQVGGGIRSTERAAALVKAGAAQIVVGTRAIERPDWLAELAASFPGAVILAADVRGRSVVTHGWTRDASLDVIDLTRSISGMPLGGLLVTAVHVEGQLRGPDLELADDVAAISSVPVIISGGITTIADLRALAARGASSAVIGMALYTGVLDPTAVAQEFGQ